MSEKRSNMPALLGTLLGIAIGFGACYFLCCKKKTGDDKHGMTTTLKQKDAHNYAVAFRTYMEYCLTPDCSNQNGYFVITSRLANDFSSGIAKIESDYSAGEIKPAYYRCIFGRRDNGTGTLINDLILVGMRNEYEELLGKTNAIQELDGVVPCPKLCDITKSLIIAGTTGTDCCRSYP